jgi:hypothetical protein
MMNQPPDNVKKHNMAKQVKTQKEMKVEDAMYNTPVTFKELFQKIRERDALIKAQNENITLLKRQLALQETVFGKMYEFTSQLQQSRYLAADITAQDAKKPGV